MDDEPYENTLTIEELRREVRRAWDRENALVKALKSLPEVPPVNVLSVLNRASDWSIDSTIGKTLQQKVGFDRIPLKSEYETGAGFWTRIRNGLLAQR